MEKVWKKEREMEEETKKMEQLRKEKEEERRREALQHLAEASGKVKCVFCISFSCHGSVTK